MIEFWNIGFYLLFFLPGFIFVQVVERHLLRENKPQFEKTIEIFLWSAFLWMIAIGVPAWSPFSYARESFLNSVREYITSMDAIPEVRTIIIRDLVDNLYNGIIFFFTVCSWSFIVANIWGMLRKSRRIGAFFVYVLGRDWYPTTAFKFFQFNIKKPVEVKVGEKKYLGILHSAPDTKEDKYIILSKPYLITQVNEEYKVEPLSLAEGVLIKVDDIDLITAYSRQITKKKD